ncbi:tetratricopeptide repeat protein [Sulfitobacter geojensis]|uniref:tetratricopeptide repeat protein n=1 Tax=Sulfitobacter geojensis TaxID=1342299 RepID=UPI003B8D6407
MRKLLLTLCVTAFGSGAMAWADCPAPADTSNELLNLIARAQGAENATQGQRISNQMWQVWLRAPDEAAQAALDAGMRRREVFDFAGAIREFDRLAAYCPNYAEGFNQRAYIHFLNGNHEKALVDLDVAMSLQPYHVAAQSGRALTLMNLGRIAEARAQMLLAVENNPWLSEASLLADGAPLGRANKEL